MEKENILIQIDNSWYYRPMGDESKEVYFGESLYMEEMIQAVVKHYGPIDFYVLTMYRSARVIQGKVTRE